MVVYKIRPQIPALVFEYLLLVTIKSQNTVVNKPMPQFRAISFTDEGKI